MVDLSYGVEHEKWILEHVKRRSGSRLDGLKRGHGYGNKFFAENIWWRLFGHFKNLHPEYEILDYRGLPFYADFMWIMGMIRIVFEIQDFSSHVEHMDRPGYRRELNRGLFMQSLQIIIVYISLDELKENPDYVRSMVRVILSPYINKEDIGDKPSNYNKFEKELLRFAARRNRIVRPAIAARELEVSRATILKYSKRLSQKGKLRPIPCGVSNRVTSYEYIGTITDSELI
jgi:hypothetical protein